MKVIEEKDVQNGVTRQITYHIPFSTREVDRLEYNGAKQVAYCGHSMKGYLSEEDFTEYESVRDLPDGKFICGECVTELSNQGTNKPYQKIVDGELNDARLSKEDTSKSG